VSWAPTTSSPVSWAPTSSAPVSTETPTTRFPTGHTIVGPPSSLGHDSKSTAAPTTDKAALSEVARATAAISAFQGKAVVGAIVGTILGLVLVGGIVMAARSCIGNRSDACVSSIVLTSHRASCATTRRGVAVIEVHECARGWV
jgi:hypothetical protein